jgi:sugar phosphate isomerase/epimerase
MDFMSYTRRTFTKVAVAAGIAPGLLKAKSDSKVSGVMIGAQSYSFRALPDKTAEAALKAYNETGLSYAELWEGHVMPTGMSREDMAKWRTSEDSIKRCKEIKSMFDKGGVDIYAFNYSFRDNWSDEELAHGMEMAKALGTKIITASSHVSIAPRVAPIAKEHGVTVAFHNHDNTKDPNEFAKPEAFAKAMEVGKNIAINLDIGHFTAANYDPVQFLEEHHDHIVTLHLKDRKKDHGPNMPFGEGETKIKEVLDVLKTKHYKIPAMIEYEYKGAADPVTEVKKCYEYCRQALA